MGRIHLRTIFSALTLALFATASTAEPQDESCQLLDVLGGNKSAELGPLLDSIGTRWGSDAVTQATQQLGVLTENGTFAGGSLFRIAQFGEDLEEHLILLRLSGGEVSAARVRYEWTPDGLALTSFEFKRRYSEVLATPFAQPPEAIDC